MLPVQTLISVEWSSATQGGVIASKASTCGTHKAGALNTVTYGTESDANWKHSCQSSATAYSNVCTALGIKDLMDFCCSLRMTRVEFRYIF
jgi:hypothetical protein